MNAPPSSRLGSALRSLTAPVRGYFNGHFEMVKSEIRSLRDRTDGLGLTESEAIAELASVVAETELHQTAAIARLTDRVDGIERELAELRRAVAAMGASIAVALDRPDTDSPGSDHRGPEHPEPGAPTT